MTQDSSAASNNGQQASSAPATSQKGGKNAKPEKNLYQPYETPTWMWVSLRAIARAIFALVFNIHLRGRQNLPKEGAYIIAANHLSWMDVPLIPAYMARKVVYMAKEELFLGKIGWLVRFLGAIPVKRGEADRQSLRAAETLLKAGKVFVIFPEGTRSKSRMMAKGHVGLGMIALRSGVPVVPVAIWGSEYSFKKFRPRITICYGQPVILKPKGSKVTREDIDEATDEIMRRIAAMLPPEYRGVYADLPVGQPIAPVEEVPAGEKLPDQPTS